MVRSSYLMTERFLRANGIRYIRTVPYHPASNGQAERLVPSASFEGQPDLPDASVSSPASCYLTAVSHMLVLGKLHQPSFCIRISVYVLASMFSRMFWRSKLLRNPIVMYTHEEGLLSVPGRIGSVHIRYTLMMHKYGSDMLTIRGDQPYLRSSTEKLSYLEQTTS